MNPDPVQVSNMLAHHRANPGISVEEHVETVRHSLGRELEARAAIYLDTKYWIFLRDAALGNPAMDSHASLLELLRNGVQKGVWFCPLSDTTFFELIHIGDADRRLATATIAQELSLGVTLCPEHERVCLEISNLMDGESWNQARTRSFAWLKLSYVLGAVIMKDDRFGKDDALAIAKAFFDHLWEVPLPKMLTTLGASARDLDFPYKRIAKNVDLLNIAHADEVGTFKATYFGEIAGVLDLYKNHAAEAIAEKFRATGQSYRPNADERAKSESEVLKLLLAIADAGKGASAFPTLHVLAKLHASIRRDKARRFRRNDLPDFHHAAGALVYCDAFLTEGPLRDAIQSGNVKLEREFACSVLASEGEALEWLDNKMSNQSSGHS
jgi:hypothetical protein